ncbi:hypothetical protein L1887_51881 [Cichorium endivia]|nr:hypothetical protein L1887_51881 [Cichorium endivia]
MQEPFEASAAPSPGGLLEPRVGAAVPMSPNPSMTLLHSPGLPPELNAGRGPRSTWSGNWKHVMRPLLDPAVPDQEVEAVLHSSALKLDSVGGILQRRVKQGYTRAPSTDAGAFRFVSQAAAITHESQKGLRLRKSVSSRTADDAIPAIQSKNPAQQIHAIPSGSTGSNPVRVVVFFWQHSLLTLTRADKTVHLAASLCRAAGRSRMGLALMREGMVDRRGDF